MFAPELFLEFWELLEQLSGRLAFEILCHFGDRNLWWHGNKDVDVVFRYMTTDYLYLVIFTDFSYEVTSSGTNATRKHWFVVLGSPHQVIFAIEDGM